MHAQPVHYILFILLATTACKLQFLRNAKRFQHQQKHTQTPIIIQKIKTCQFLLHYCTFCRLLKVWKIKYESMNEKKECNDLVLLVENGSGTSFDLLLTEEQYLITIFFHLFTFVWRYHLENNRSLFFKLRAFSVFARSIMAQYMQHVMYLQSFSS